ncbi:MAG: peptidylprolyl isomerase [Cyanobacteria bacterium P01_F01_bin.42]
MKIALSLSAIALLLGTTACGSVASNDSSSQDASSSVLAQAPLQSQSNTPSGPKLTGKATAEMTVNDKTIVVELDGTHAPFTVGNFVDLAQKGVYNGTRFHRVIKSPQPFVAQGGDPQGKDPSVPVSNLGTGNYIDPGTKLDRYIPLEIKPDGAEAPLYSQTFKAAGINTSPQLSHRKGAIAMARTPAPDSASAQFYFALADLDFLDGDYAVFGYVNDDSMSVVEAIEQGDVIDSVKITKGADQLES